MSKSKNILEIRNVTKKFNTPNNKVLTACDNISLEFEEGKILAIVGESGCGKSTLMKMIVQLENVTSGEILYEGEDITKLKGEKLRQNRRHIQMVFQDPNTSFNPRMKVRDIICEPLLNFGLIKKNQRDDIAKEFLEMVDLPKDFSNRYIHNMSGGQRQRIGIARALTLNPKVVIFDESTSALDVLTQKKIIDLIIKLQKEKNITIGLVCHDIHLVSQISDKVAVMYLGNLVEVIDGKADIVVANILAEIICILTDDVKRVMKDGGVFITSGIIHDRVDMVCEKLEATGFEVIEKNRDGEWNCIVAKLK